MDEALVRTFAEECGATAEWLLNKVGLKATQPNRFDYQPTYPGAGRGRNFASAGAGAGLMRVLVGAVRGKHVDIRTNVHATRLAVDQSGRVVGVLGANSGEAYKARRGVVLCTGGFAANDAMKGTFLRMEPVLTELPGVDGDGILMGMGMGAGAALSGMNDHIGVPLFPVPGRSQGVTLTMATAPSTLMVNREGQRF